MSHQDYFDDQRLRSVPEYWRRLGGAPPVAGKRVLELGSGHGAMALELASAGADVLGLDLNPELLNWAREHVEPREVAGSLRFAMADVRTLDESGFDYVFSKDTFEHVQNLTEVLVALRDRLAPGGQIWAGFSPLFYSPWGDHGEAGRKIPWAHAVSRRYLLWGASRRRGAPMRNLADLGLNGMTPAGFRQAVADAGLRFEYLRYNASDKALMKALSRVRQIPALERYATVSIYTKLAPR
jgi:SAM-dependent methyltransferase